MKIALVHDYLNEFGGAEKVLRTLADMYPDAPIYTAFCVPGSSACRAFGDRKVITSWMQNVPYYKRLYSPLRFLIPWIWSSFDFSEFDLVITSASWYVTKGMKAKLEICYCHTPPRWLYGYQTSIDLQKYWIVRVYALIVGHFLRMYDFKQAQKVTVFVANSKNVAERINKFYRRKAEVIYPPVEIPKSKLFQKKSDYYLMVTRVVGGKGIELARETSQKYGFKLKIAGEFAGLKRMTGVETVGRVSDDERTKLMSEALGFLALEKDPDFGMTPVEAMACGTPVIAFNSGGYKETVIDGKTGVLFDEYSTDGLWEAIKKSEKIKWDDKVLKKQAAKFSEEIFKKEIQTLVAKTNSSSD